MRSNQWLSNYSVITVLFYQEEEILPRATGGCSVLQWCFDVAECKMGERKGEMREGTKNRYIAEAVHHLELPYCRAHYFLQWWSMNWALFYVLSSSCVTQKLVNECINESSVFLQSNGCYTYMHLCKWITSLFLVSLEKNDSLKRESICQSCCPTFGL